MGSSKNLKNGIKDDFELNPILFTYRQITATVTLRPFILEVKDPSKIERKPNNQTASFEAV